MKPIQYSLALAVGAALVVAPVASAQAAAPVTIQTIPTTTVKFDSTKTFKAKYVKQKNVKIDKAVLKVVKGDKIIATDAPSVKLGKGSYNVRQTVVYRVVTKAASTETVTLSKGSVVDASCKFTEVVPLATDSSGTTSGDFKADCTPEPTADTSYGAFAAGGSYVDDGDGGTTLYFDDSDDGNDVSSESVKVGSTADVQDVKTTADVQGTKTTPAELSAAKTVSKSQKLTVKSLKEPKGCASKAEFSSVKASYVKNSYVANGDKASVVAKKLDSSGSKRYGGKEGDVTYEVRRYKSCEAGTVVEVFFINGKAGDKYRGPVNQEG
ncbi:MAG: hypothetical protein PGN07_07680 [Aeromicrobium erythreum]